MTTAKEICETAASLVSGDRDRQHGAKEQNFTNIAALWREYIDRTVVAAMVRGDGKWRFGPRDVANMMVLMKIARTLSGQHNPDDYIDACGYAACAGELAEKANAPEV